jgi:PAS domain S-box-containing protein
MRAIKHGVIVGLANHTVLIAKDGTERAIDDSAAPIRCDKGQVVGCVLVFRDVTERRRADRAARFLASIIESSDDAIIGKDVNGIITSWNSAAERLFGYTAAEAIGRSIAIIAPPDRANEMPAILDRIKRGEQVQHFDTMRRAKDGRLVPISLTVSPIKDRDGRIIGASKIARDISERKKAEQALREERGRLHATLNGIGDGVIVTDAKGHVTMMNPVAESLTGWKEEAVARPLDEVFCIINEQTRQEVENPVKRVIREGVVVGLANHTILIAKDTTERPIDDSAAPIKDEQGRVAGVVLVFRDNTERRRTEAALREADRRKDEFLATLAHELRNPLAPIRNAVQVFRIKEVPDPQLQSARDIIDRQVQQMARLVDDLLDVSRITRGKIQLRKERIDLPAAVRSAVEAVRPLIDAQAHQLTITLPPQPVCLDADPIRLAQVVSNLLHNAAKFTEKGGHVWLTVEKQGGEIAISVRDTGIGIAAEHLPHLFAMFYQVVPALERSQGGLGIGLALVKGLVELHGGSAEARSGGPGKGSEVTVRLPVASSPQELEDSGKSGEDPKPGGMMPRCRILIADDLPDSVESLAMILRLGGHDIQTARDGLEAVQAAATLCPDVIFLDIGMPKMNGYEAARSIRQHPWGRHIVLVALTGWGQEDDKRRATEAGFDHHLTKPVDAVTLDKLLSLITPKPPQ